MDLNSRIDDARVVENVDGWTYRWTNGRKTRSLYHAMPEASATKTLPKAFLTPMPLLMLR